MSGPKISFYSLTGHARMIVMKQYRCDQRQIACAEQIRKSLREIAGTKGRIRQSEATLMMLQERSGGYETRLEEIRELQGRFEGEVKALQEEFRTFHPKMSSKYRIEDEALAKKEQELQRILEFQKRVDKLYREVMLASLAGEDAAEEETKKTQAVVADYLVGESAGEDPSGGTTPAFSGKTPEEKRREISENVGGISSFDWDPEPERRRGSGRDSGLSVSGRTFEERKEADRAELNKLLDDNKNHIAWSAFEGTMDPFPPELVSDIRAALENLERISQMPHLTAFESVTLKRIGKRVDDWYRECAARQEEYERQQAEERKEAKRRREAEIWRQLEQQLIADTVDEVMKEMGYDLIGRREVRKRSGKHFKNELFRFGEGTAVNVTYSPDGQISMELGGIAGEDRIPSEEETELLTKDMETFCGEFAEFERRMLERGVIVGNRVAMMPPAPEYASIININDYEKEPGAEAEEISVRAGRKKVEKKTRTLP